MIICEEDNFQHSYIQVSPGILAGIPIDSSSIPELKNELEKFRPENCCSVNLKERVPPEEEDIYFDRFVETLYFVPKRFLEDVERAKSFGFNYYRWDAVAINGCSYPRCYLQYVEQYGCDEAKERFRGLVTFHEELRSKWRSRKLRD